ncbi:histidinol dehydrogenase [Ochromonadaceae sp. CCMP2298]|nr:histidinol dehydrogenase [Ochromonadaceae sp. CCMP2298]
MSSEGLRFVTPEEVTGMHFDPVDPQARDQAADLLKEVRERKLEGLIDCAVKLRDLESRESKLFYDKDDLKKAYDALDKDAQGVLQRTAERIRKFAQSQRDSICEMTTDIAGGKAGHFVAPVLTAGCYAPGGRYPLPSSVLMTAVTARTAGVKNVWVASPRPAPATLAAAHVAGADGLMAAGGAHAIGAFAYSAGPVPTCDVIVGPGNKWVTAAKSLVSGICAIDMLAGPSEVLVIADETCDPDVVAADLLAQAEHDTEARPILLCTSETVAKQVNERLRERLAILPTAPVAAEAVKKGFVCVCPDVAAAVRVSDTIGPEHLEIHTADATAVAKMCGSYGGIFIGTVSAEVLGDYGAGPNHVLPTCGTSRYTGGLSVFTFLRIRTWMDITDKAAAQAMVEDCVALARIEGLEGHARAAECRLTNSESPSKRARK